MTSTSRSARLAKWLSVPVGLVISALLIWQASYAAFSDTTSTEGSWSSGTVAIVEETPHEADFVASNMAPGAPYQTATMRAHYDGTLDAEVSFYGTDLTESESGFADYIDLEISAVPFGPDAPTGGVDPFFTGTLAEFHENHRSFEAGWRSPVPVKPGYGAEVTIKYRLNADTPNDFQAESASMKFVGEAKQHPRQG